jgi:hypothetical protein
MINKTGQIAFLDVDSIKVLFSDDGGVTWIAGKVDSDGRVRTKTVNDEGIISKAILTKQASAKTELGKLNSLIPDEYDYIDLSYADGNLSEVIYKTGGSEGEIVSTLSLSYDEFNRLIDVSAI